jgi:hypothetical protein
MGPVRRDEFGLIRVGREQWTGVTGTGLGRWAQGLSSAGGAWRCWHAAVRGETGRGRGGRSH